MSASVRERWIRPLGVGLGVAVILVLLDAWIRPTFLLRLLHGPRNLFAYYLPSLLLLSWAVVAWLGTGPGTVARAAIAWSAAALALAQHLAYLAYGRLVDEYELRFLWRYPDYLWRQATVLRIQDVSFWLGLGALLWWASGRACRWLHGRWRRWTPLPPLVVLVLTGLLQYPRQLHHTFGAALASLGAVGVPEAKALVRGVHLHRDRSCRPDTAPVPPPRKLLFVIGESAARTHMSLYGYRRPTTPELDRRRTRIERFERAFTIGTWTRIVLPYLLVGHETYDPERDLERLPTIFHYAKCAGYRTVLIASQTLEYNGLAALLVDRDVDRFVDGRTLYPDADLDVGADDARALPLVLDELRAPGRLVLVWITNGMHHPYTAHYPEAEARWRPTGATPADPEALVNAYDNALRHHDRLLGRLWRELEAAGLLAETLWIYVADHGERLGERELFFHGSYEPAELAIPLWWHLPRAWRARAAGLRANLARPVFADDLVPTLARLLGQRPHPAVTGRDLWAPVAPRWLFLTPATLNGPPHARPVYLATDGEWLYRYEADGDRWRYRPLLAAEPWQELPATRVPAVVRGRLTPGADRS